MESSMEGLNVVDLSEGYEGYAGMMLAEFGASVTKVEPLEGDYIRQLGPPFIAGESAAFLGVNRGKRSLALAWKEKADAKAVLQRLITQTDVLISTLYANQAESLGLTYESVRAINSRIIYCSITPMGDIGSYANYRASDLELQSMFGHWRYLGGPKSPADPNESPLRLGVPIAALNSAIFALQGIAAALIYRLRKGVGQKVMISEAGALIAMRNIQFAAESEPDEWEGHTVGHMRPPSRATETKDRPIYWGFTGGVDAGVPDFLNALGLGHLLRNLGAEPGSVGLLLQGDIRRQIEDKFKGMTSEEVMSLIRKFGGAAVHWNTFETMSQEPQALAMNMIAEFEHPAAGAVKTMGLPWWFSDTPPAVGRPPLLGEHTRQVLEAAGYSHQDVDRLAREGFIREAGK